MEDLQDGVYKVLMRLSLEMETLKLVHSLIKITVNLSLSKLNIYRTSKLLESPGSQDLKLLLFWVFLWKDKDSILPRGDLKLWLQGVWVFWT